jgi:hypothetical protein
LRRLLLRLLLSVEPFKRGLLVGRHESALGVVDHYIRAMRRGLRRRLRFGLGTMRATPAHKIVAVVAVPAALVVAAAAAVSALGS